MLCDITIKENYMAVKPGRISTPSVDAADREVDTQFLDGLVGYWLRRASNVMAADFARAVQEAGGLRSVLVSILAIVGANPGIGQTQLGQVLSIQRANMVPLLSSLIDDGLVRREASAEDKRVFELYLTEEGTARLETTQALILAHEKRLLSVLTARERQTLIGLLAKIAATGAE
jgi:DNA-binding MarR family transcriptional regulator